MEQLSARSPSIALPGVVAVPSKWLALLATSLGVFMASLDATIVNVAFPEISRSFPDATRAHLSWVLNGYTIAFGALLIVSGRIADRYGRKRVFFSGLAVFTVASLLCGIAPNEQLLVASRVVQGVGASMILPSSLALLLSAWPASERATAVGLWGSVAAIAAATGPSLGALIVDGPGWRWAFLLNLPVGLFAAWLGARVLRESRAERSETRLDIPGVALITVAMGTLSLGLVQGRDWGWTSPEVIGSLLAALVATTLFILQEARHPAPVVPLGLFRARSFAVSNLAMLAFGIGFFSMLLGTVLFLTSVWEYSTLRAGLAITPTPLVAAMLAGPGGRFAARHGYRGMLAAGSSLAAAATLWMALAVGGSPDYLREWFIPALVLGAGIGLTFAHLSGAAVAGLPPANFAVGSAVSQTFRNVGSMTGIAILVAVLGTPDTKAESMDAFETAFLVSSSAFALSAVIALGLARKR